MGKYTVKKVGTSYTLSCGDRTILSAGSKEMLLDELFKMIKCIMVDSDTFSIPVNTQTVLAMLDQNIADNHNDPHK